MASNAPWGVRKPNSGLQIWRNRAEAKDLLQCWWNTDLTAQDHPYEQSSIKSMYRENKWPIAVMEAFQWMMPEQWPELAAKHITGKHRDKRATMMQRHLGDQLVADLTIQRIDTTAMAQQNLE